MVGQFILGSSLGCRVRGNSRKLPPNDRLCAELTKMFPTREDHWALQTESSVWWSFVCHDDDQHHYDPVECFLGPVFIDTHQYYGIELIFANTVSYLLGKVQNFRRTNAVEPAAECRHRPIRSTCPLAAAVSVKATYDQFDLKWLQN